MVLSFCSVTSTLPSSPLLCGPPNLIESAVPARCTGTQYVPAEMVGNVEEWILLALALTFIIIRVFSRLKLVGISQFQLDDYLMPVAGVCLFSILIERTQANRLIYKKKLVYTADVVAAYLVGAKYDGLTNSYMTTKEREDLDPTSDEAWKRIGGSKIQIVGWSLYVAGLWVVKFCLAIFYSRLTCVSSTGHRRRRRKINP